MKTTSVAIPISKIAALPGLPFRVAFAPTIRNTFGTETPLLRYCPYLGDDVSVKRFSHAYVLDLRPDLSSLRTQHIAAQRRKFVASALIEQHGMQPHIIRWIAHSLGAQTLEVAAPTRITRASVTCTATRLLWGADLQARGPAQQHRPSARSCSLPSPQWLLQNAFSSVAVAAGAPIQVAVPSAAVPLLRMSGRRKEMAAAGLTQNNRVANCMSGLPCTGPVTAEFAAAAGQGDASAAAGTAAQFPRLAAIADLVMLGALRTQWSREDFTFASTRYRGASIRDPQDAHQLWEQKQVPSSRSASYSRRMPIWGAQPNLQIANMNLQPSSATSPLQQWLGSACSFASTGAMRKASEPAASSPTPPATPSPSLGKPDETEAGNLSCAAAMPSLPARGLELSHVFQTQTSTQALRTVFGVQDLHRPSGSPASIHTIHSTAANASGAGLDPSHSCRHVPIGGGCGQHCVLWNARSTVSLQNSSTAVSSVVHGVLARSAETFGGDQSGVQLASWRSVERPAHSVFSLGAQQETAAEECANTQMPVEPACLLPSQHSWLDDRLLVRLHAVFQGVVCAMASAASIPCCRAWEHCVRLGLPVSCVNHPWLAPLDLGWDDARFVIPSQEQLAAVTDTHVEFGLLHLAALLPSKQDGLPSQLGHIDKWADIHSHLVLSVPSAQAGPAPGSPCAFAVLGACAVDKPAFRARTEEARVFRLQDMQSVTGVICVATPPRSGSGRSPELPLWASDWVALPSHKDLAQLRMEAGGSRCASHQSRRDACNTIWRGALAAVAASKAARGGQSVPQQGCSHIGPCVKNNTSWPCVCADNDMPCTKLCSCFLRCKRSFVGCGCQSQCALRCDCENANHECDPDVCIDCGASAAFDANRILLQPRLDSPQSLPFADTGTTPEVREHFNFLGKIQPGSREATRLFQVMGGNPLLPSLLESTAGLEAAEEFLFQVADSTCSQMSMSLRRVHKLRVGISTLPGAGFGLFIDDAAKKGDLLGIYTGEVISQLEAERRGAIYDARNRSYLFELNVDESLDATYKGSILRFANHSAANFNAKAQIKVLRNCEQSVGIIATKAIAPHSEILFDYGYHKTGVQHLASIRAKARRQEAKEGSPPAAPEEGPLPKKARRLQRSQAAAGVPAAGHAPSPASSADSVPEILHVYTPGDSPASGFSQDVPSPLPSAQSSSGDGGFAPPVCQSQTLTALHSSFDSAELNSSATNGSQTSSSMNQDQPLSALQAELRALRRSSHGERGLAPTSGPAQAADIALKRTAMLSAGTAMSSAGPTVPHVWTPGAAAAADAAGTQSGVRVPAAHAYSPPEEEQGGAGKPRKKGKKRQRSRINQLLGGEWLDSMRSWGADWNLFGSQ